MFIWYISAPHCTATPERGGGEGGGGGGGRAIHRQATRDRKTEYNRSSINTNAMGK